MPPFARLPPALLQPLRRTMSSSPSFKQAPKVTRSTALEADQAKWLELRRLDWQDQTGKEASYVVASARLATMLDARTASADFWLFLFVRRTARLGVCVAQDARQGRRRRSVPPLSELPSPPVAHAFLLVLPP